MTVREILTRYPFLEEVFDKHGMAGCGGPNGPDEPVGEFALVHRVDPTALVSDLNARLAAEKGRVELVRPVASITPANRAIPSSSRSAIYRPFIVVSLAFALTMGFTTGTVLLLASILEIPSGLWWIIYVQGHGVAQLFGWAGLFTMGVAYHVVPRFRNTSLALSRLSIPSLALVALGVFLRQVTQGFSQYPAVGALLVFSGVLLLLGVLIFALVISLTLARVRRSREPFEFWIWAASGWAVVAASLHLAVVIQIALSGTRVAPAALDRAFIQAALFGFLLSFIMGVSVRLLPAFMRLAPPGKVTLVLVMVLFHVGVAWQVVVWSSGLPSTWWGWGGILQAAAMAIFTISLGVFGRRTNPREYGPAVYSRYELYIRAAYGWLLVAAMFWLYLALHSLLQWSTPMGGAISLARHVVALGVVTMMILGLGSRILPMFEGARLQWPRLMDVAFISLNLSVALRLVFSSVSVPGGGFLLALSGPSGLLALVCFALVVWRTSRPQAREDRRPTVYLNLGGRAVAARGAGPGESTIGPTTMVADAVERWPDTLDVFLRHGFAPLTDSRLRNSVGRVTTVAQACEIMNVDLSALLVELNRVASENATGRGGINLSGNS